MINNVKGQGQINYKKSLSLFNKCKIGIECTKHFKED